jgi:adenosylcobinamide-GDP ribazoletransferase
MDFARAFLADLAACLRFYSRISVPALPFEADPHAMPDFRMVVRALPVAGALIGLVGAAMLVAASALGLPPTVAALLAIAALVLTTGAFHEDGLADTADGFGGGATRERKLDIMKDSRIGTYGGAALVLSLGLRWAALNELVEAAGPLFGALVIVAVAAISRTAALMPLSMLPPARDEGASWKAGKPDAAALAIAAIMAMVLAFLPVWGGASPRACAVAILLCMAAAWIMTRIAARQIGGQTGDVSGAAQQLAEIAGLCGFVIGLRL